MEVCLREHEIVLSDNLAGEILTNFRRKIELPENLINRTGTLLREHARFSTLESSQRMSVAILMISKDWEKRMPSKRSRIPNR